MIFSGCKDTPFSQEKAVSGVRNGFEIISEKIF